MAIYTKYTTNDSTLAHVLFAYCEGKNFFWRMYFGWRGAKFYDEETFHTFIIPTRKIEELENIAYLLKRNLK